MLHKDDIFQNKKMTLDFKHKSHEDSGVSANLESEEIQLSADEELVGHMMINTYIYKASLKNQSK